MTVWICGQHNGDGEQWEVQGVFSTEALAIAACKTQSWFIGPVELDAISSPDGEEWEGAYYPLATPEKEMTINENP